MKTTVSKNSFDVIIIGGGPAGLSAAVLLARSNRRVLLVDGGNQRNLRSHGLYNFITRNGVLPPKFLNLAYEELKQYDLKFLAASIKTAIREKDGSFLVTDEKRRIYKSRRLLLCTGVEDYIPEVDGIRELWGCAVFHCPFCDGYECRGKNVGLYAKNKNGFGMALSLKHLDMNVSLFTDGAFYLRPFQKEILRQKNIEVITTKISHLERRGKKLKAVMLHNGTSIPCDALFTHHGMRAKDDLLKQLGCRCTNGGLVVTNRRQQTSVPGVYAAGDISYGMHFVIVAAAEGVKAGVAIHDELLKEELSSILNAEF